MKVSAGVPASSVSATATLALRVEIQEQAEQRRRDHERQAGGEPVRERLGGDREFERRVAHQDQVERAVLVVGGEQPVERQQAGEQRAEPQDRRADAREQREIGADRERHQRHDDQEEQHADAARRRRRAPRAACRAGTGRQSALMRAAPERASSLRARRRPIGPWVAATIRPPPARWPRISPASRVLRGAVERRGRLVEQPDRALRRRAAGRSTAAAAGRPTDRPAGRSASAAEADRGQRRVAARLGRRRDSAPRRRDFRRPSATASARPGGRDNGPARRGCARGRRRRARAARPASRSSPAIIRSSEDLPAPLRPVTTSASPPRPRNSSPENTSRPPRTQARSCAVKPHRGRRRAQAAATGHVGCNSPANPAAHPL